VRFPLRDWIDAHPGCRHDLASSGMRGAIPAPAWPARRPPRDIADRLHEELAGLLGVAPARLFLARGATEANAWVLGHLARAARGRSRRLRVRYPEYPPLFDAGRLLGFTVASDARPAAVAVVSQPRNPEGDLWSRAQLDAWADGARAVLVDETFREFLGTPSFARAGKRGLWATGSFTKFFGADDVRVGFAIAPPEEVRPFERYVGLLSDELAPASAAVALGLLRDLPRWRREVAAVVGPNLAAFARRFPSHPRPRVPLVFDRLGRGDGLALARRCLARSVLVCPGAFFGERRGVRLCLTRPDAEASLRAYARVRSRVAAPA
jgi:histidinol-phosphate/aromatic aminotransferase/cobyric acid decarboxylase-like protein